MSKQRRETGRHLSSGSSLSYRAARGTIRGVASFFFKPEITGYENMPLEGPVILAPVHRSLVDFTFTIFVTRRMLFFMAKEELWRSRVLAAWFPTVGVFPVHRDAPDRKSLSRAEDVLKQGGVLVMFPEGARQSGQEIGELLEGVAFLAARTGALIVPLGIGGSDRAMPKGSKIPKRVPIQLVVGEPLAPPVSEEGLRVPRRKIHEMSEELRRRLQDAYDESLAKT